MKDIHQRDRLYKNARDAIDMGITDYATGTPTRAASGVRNFYSGVLLLAKYILAAKAPAADIMAVIGRHFEPVPGKDGGVELVQKGHRTIDFEEIGARFKKFGIEIDRKALTDLARIRNEVEHFYTGEDPEAIREVMAKAFPLTISLFHLAEKDPRDELGQAWDEMIEIQCVYEKVLERCRASFEDVEWKSKTLADAPYNCPHCHSDLVIQDDPRWSKSHDANVRCLACGERIDGQAAMERALDLHFELESYLAAKDGADAPLDTCPECGVDAYIMSEEEVGCANCGLVLGDCGRCHTRLVPSNVDPDSHGLCSYCGHLFSKDD